MSMSIEGVGMPSQAIDHNCRSDDVEMYSAGH